MRRWAGSTATVMLLACTVGTALGADRPAWPDFPVADRLQPADPMPVRPTDWGRKDVSLTDVVYATIPGFRPLHLDLYRATDATSPRPLIVVLHGGGWAQANPRAGAVFTNFPGVLAEFARRGFVVASIEYRLSGEAAFPAQLDDLRSAIRFLRDNAARFGIDGERVGLWGLSAGAQLAALGALDCKAGTCVQAWAGWFGPYDLAAYVAESPGNPAVPNLLHCPAAGCDSTALRAASPVHFVDSSDPPALLVHGERDTNVSKEQSMAMAARLRTAGVPAELLLVPDVAHGFAGPTEAVTRGATRAALTATEVRSPGGGPSQAASTAAASQRADSTGAYSRNGPNSPQPAGPGIR